MDKKTKELKGMGARAVLLLLIVSMTGLGYGVFLYSVKTLSSMIASLDVVFLSAIGVVVGVMLLCYCST